MASEAADADSSLPAMPGRHDPAARLTVVPK
jgi:hypothetical protein